MRVSKIFLFGFPVVAFLSGLFVRDSWQLTRDVVGVRSVAVHSESCPHSRVHPDKCVKQFHLVLHVGPQKTGSTTLQAAWNMPQGLIRDLREDNYQYAYLSPNLGFFNCDIDEAGGRRNCKPSPKLEDLINQQKGNNNMLLSDENLAANFAPALQTAIDQDHWRVTVIVVYRRIHEWLVSWYNQINKTTNKNLYGDVLFDDVGMPYRIPHEWWPDEGGEKIPVFSEWYKQFTRYFDRSDMINQHRSVALVNTYGPIFDNVIVHNMHGEGDLLTNFMCDSMPDATTCCERLKKGAVVIPKENESVNLDHDILAVAARERGLLEKNIRRSEAQAAVSNFTKTTGTVIPRKCDYKMIEEIRRWLFGSEEQLFSDIWTEQKSLDLEETFDSYVKQGKLCDVDLDRVFKDLKWINFFKSLGNGFNSIVSVPV